MAEQPEFLPHDTNLATTHDPIVLVANLQTGAIKEIPCGPKNASHINGDRPLVWNKVDGKAAVPKHWRKRFRRYDDLCADPALMKKHKLTEKRARAYFEDYARFVQSRGRGKHVRPGMTVPELHPELERRPNGIKAKTAQDQKSFEDRFAELERRAAAADLREVEREKGIKDALREIGLEEAAIEKAFAGK